MAYDLTGKKVLDHRRRPRASARVWPERSPRAGATVGICARRADRLAEVLADCRTHVARVAIVDDRSRRPRACGGVRSAGRRRARRYRPAREQRRHPEAPPRLELTADVVEDVMRDQLLLARAAHARTAATHGRAGQRSHPHGLVGRRATRAATRSGVQRDQGCHQRVHGVARGRPRRHGHPRSTSSTRASSTPSCSTCPTTSRRCPISRRFRSKP